MKKRIPDWYDDCEYALDSEEQSEWSEVWQEESDRRTLLRPLVYCGRVDPGELLRPNAII